MGQRMLSDATRQIGHHGQEPVVNSRFPHDNRLRRRCHADNRAELSVQVNLVRGFISGAVSAYVDAAVLNGQSCLSCGGEQSPASRKRVAEIRMRDRAIKQRHISSGEIEEIGWNDQRSRPPICAQTANRGTREANLYPQGLKAKRHRSVVHLMRGHLMASAVALQQDDATLQQVPSHGARRGWHADRLTAERTQPISHPGSPNDRCSGFHQRYCGTEDKSDFLANLPKWFVDTRFIGCGTALVTPFQADGALDEPTFRRLVKRQIDSGITFIVPCGTTGEVPTLNHEEKVRVVGIAIEEARGRVPVVAGAGGYDTAEVIASAQEFERVGADAILSVTPYYNKPSQEGLLAHYKALAASISIPIILYSVQPRTNVNIEVSTILKLAEIPNIIGVKEASGNIGQIASIIHRAPKDFLILSGDDAITIPLIALGGHGIISVASNEIPAKMTALAKAAYSGDWETARALHNRFLPLMEINFCEPNPQPAKAAMEMMGLLENNVRLPLIPASESSKERIRQVLKTCELI